MYYLLIHIDTETTGLSPTKNGIHSLGFIGEIVNQNDPLNIIRIEFLGYWEFNPVGKERDEYALKVGGVTDGELDARESHSNWHCDILNSLERIIAIAKDRYGDDLEVYMVGSYPEYDVNMVDGMNWGWSLRNIFKPENIIDTKTAYKQLMEEGTLAKTSCSLQNIVSVYSLTESVVWLMGMLKGGKWYIQYGNANPFERPNPHTSVYDCLCTLVALRHSSIMGS